MMLLQTNSYIVPKDKRTEHARLVARFRQVLARIGCDHFEAYEQVGANWAGETTGRFVQIMRFRDRKHQQAVQAAERSDAAAQALIKEFCELINFPYQQQQGLFAVGFYTSLLPAPGARVPPPVQTTTPSASGSPPANSQREQSTDAVASRDNGDTVAPALDDRLDEAAPRTIDLESESRDAANSESPDEVSPRGDSASDRHVEA